MRRRSTLIELLVIIATLMVLVAIVVATHRRHSISRSSPCPVNVKILILAAQMYAQDFDGVLAPYGDHACSVGSDCTYWWEMLRPYTHKRHSLRCPRKRPHSPFSDYAIVHNHVAGCGPGNALTDFRYPNETAFLMDGQYSSTDPTGYYLAYCRLCAPSGFRGVHDWNGIGAGIHNEGAYVAFVDGHLKWLKGTFLLDTTEDEEHRKLWWHDPPE